MVTLIITIVVGCGATADPPGVYRESKGQVLLVPVQPADERVSLTPFVRLKNGKVALPKLFYLQKHHTSTGVRDVEKIGPMSVVAAPYRKAINLPVSSEIEEYLFLAGGPSLVEEEQVGKKTVVTKWTPSGLLRVSAKDIDAEKPLMVPPLADLEREAKAEKQLFDKLYKNLERARREAEERGKIPITPDTEVPWWAE